MATTPNSVITAQTPNAGALNVVLSTAMTTTKAYDGTETAGTALGLVFTAGSNGAQLAPAVINFCGTNGATASGTTSASVMRFWLNNGSANTTAGNNIFLGEVTLPATALSATAATSQISFNFGGRTIPATYRVYAGITTAIGGTNAAVNVSLYGSGDL